MSISNTPRLCGGTFFILLLEAGMPRGKFSGNPDGKNTNFTAPNMLMGLIRVMNPNFQKPYEGTFKSNTSQYKSCDISKGTYLPFDDATIIKAFDDMIKSHYSKPLLATTDFISTFINIEIESKRTWLVKALLELIETDDSIDGEDTFYILEDGKTVTKNAISCLTDICLQSFILGIWHFIVINRPDNTIGRSTVSQWHEAPETSGQQHKFKSNIGDSITRPISIRILDLDNINPGPEPEVTIEDDYNDTHTTEEDFNDRTRKSTVHQIINNPTIVNQYGQKNIHIEYVDKLNF